MKISRLLLLAIAFLAASVTAFAQAETRVVQEHYRDYDERNNVNDIVFPDWAVLFTYPENARNIRVIAHGNKENQMLRSADINYNFNINGRRYVKVLIGRRVRKNAEYGGNRHNWANSLRLEYYTTFQPRGRRRE